MLFKQVSYVYTILSKMRMHCNLLYCACLNTTHVSNAPYFYQTFKCRNLRQSSNELLVSSLYGLIFFKTIPNWKPSYDSDRKYKKMSVAFVRC